MGAESVPRRIIQGRELSPILRRGLEDAHLFVQSRTLRTKQLLGFDCAMANRDLAAPSPTFCPIQAFHSLSRAGSTGKVYETDFVHLIDLRNGRVARFQEFFDTYAAAEAFRR